MFYIITVINPLIIMTIKLTTDAMASPNVYVLAPPDKVKPDIFETIQKPLSLTVAPNMPPDKQANAIKTGCIATVEATDDIIVILVIPATVPEPVICLKITPNPHDKTNISVRFPPKLVTKLTIASFTPDNLIISANEPPAPVIKKTIPADSNDFIADTDVFWFPIYLTAIK